MGPWQIGHIVEQNYVNPLNKQEDHYGPISLTWVLSSKGRQSYVPTCDPQGRASFDPRGIKWTNLVRIHQEMINTKYQGSRPSTFRE